MFYGGILTPSQPPKLEDHPLLIVCDCVFSIFAATLLVFSIRNLSTIHAVVTFHTSKFSFVDLPYEHHYCAVPFSKIMAFYTLGCNRFSFWMLCAAENILCSVLSVVTALCNFETYLFRVLHLQRNSVNRLLLTKRSLYFTVLAGRSLPKDTVSVLQLINT